LRITISERTALSVEIGEAGEPGHEPVHEGSGINPYPSLVIKIQGASDGN
jgi:hypothetical protein